MTTPNDEAPNKDLYQTGNKVCAVAHFVDEESKPARVITLATLPQATEQEVFDQVVEHLLTQMERSTIGLTTENEKARCRYRAKTLSCAAGCLIADNEYSPSMENRSWTSLVELETVPDMHSGLITDLQQIHDWNMTSDWHFELKRLAGEKGLAFNWKPKEQP